MQRTILLLLLVAVNVSAETFQHHAKLRKRSLHTQEGTQEDPIEVVQEPGHVLALHQAMEAYEETHKGHRQLRHHHHHPPTEAEIQAAEKKDMEEEAEAAAKAEEVAEEVIVMEESEDDDDDDDDDDSDDDDEPVVEEAATAEAPEEEVPVVAAAAVVDESPIEAILDGTDPNEKYWIAGLCGAGIALVVLGIAARNRRKRKRPAHVETLNLHHPRDPEIEMVLSNNSSAATGLSQKVLGGGKRNSTPSFGNVEEEPIWSIRHSMTTATAPEAKQAMNAARPNKKNSPPASAFKQHKNKF